MKKKFKLTVAHILSIFGTFLFSFLLSQAVSAQASFEIMCRGKAKELAAETYKGCMTEYRQTQLEQIRKEYKEELSQLKNQYDKKLKKLSGKSSVTASATQNSTDYVVEPSATPTVQSAGQNAAEPTIELKRSRQRRSGARMPTKKIGTGTQVIDLSKSVEAQLNSSSEIAEAARTEKKDISDNNDVEIVELPIQE